MVTLQQLKTIMPGAGGRAEIYYAALVMAMSKFLITSGKREAAFLATIAHESGQLRYTKEIWGPTPAQQRYEGRQDLGNMYVGDGRRFMGRGFIQITGRSNYQKITDAFRIDFVSQPELLETPDYAAMSAAWWWATHGCNEAADVPDFMRVTKIVNGGYNGIDDRLRYYDIAMRTLAPDFSNVVSGSFFNDGP